MLKMLDLFSGIGGFSLAASWTGGIETVAFCEIEPFCQQVLKKHWPDVPIYPDIKELNGHEVVREHGAVDIVCGGFPCQPFSVAGKQRGKEDDRHLWPEMFRIIQETNPTWIVGENVTGLIDMELEQCFLDLESEGYEVQTFIIPACAVNAPHKRDRVWIIANSSSERWIQVGKSQQERLSDKYIESNHAFWRYCTDLLLDMEPDWSSPSSGVKRNDNGLSEGVDRLKGCGNSIVPQVVYPILQGIVEIEGAIT